MDGTGGAEADVNIRESDPEEADPRPHHVASIEATDAIITLGAGG